MERIHLFNHSDLSWAFNSEKPHISLSLPDIHFYEQLDPFPCYSHQKELLLKEIEYVENKVPLPYKPEWMILPFESFCRTNGQATDNKKWLEDGKTLPRPYITIFGKRIPIMPAMTRYLICHEYCHVIHMNLAHIFNMDYNEFGTMYAQKVRKMDSFEKYGALRWHNNEREILANDLRILIFDRENEFWPHDVQHPSKRPDIKEWWEETLKKL